MANNVYSWSTTASSNTSLDGLTWAEGMQAGSVNNSARQMMASIRAFVADLAGATQAGGTANALTLTSNAGIDSLTDGRVVAFTATATNTGSATLNVNVLGTKALRKMGNAGDMDLEGGEIQNGGIYVVRYSTAADTASGGWIVENPTSSGVPVATVLDYAGSTAPAGFLMCYGQNVSRTTYASLFSVIGTTYGTGDGSTTFTLPDARGRVSAGKDDMGGTSADRLTNQSGGVDGDTLGASGGAETHALTTAQLASHTHGPGSLAGSTSTAGNHTHYVGGTYNASGLGSTGNYVASYPAANNPATSAAGDHTHTVSITSGTTGSEGSGNAHNNVQPTIIFNKIIKT